MKSELARAGGVLAVIVVLLAGLAFASGRAQSAGQAAATSSSPVRHERGGPDGHGPYFLGEELAPPRPAPEFELTDWNGQQVRLRDFRGKTLLVTFAYTACPDACPLLAARFKALETAMAGHLGKSLELAFITVDPETDTPEHLAEYMQSVGGSWHFLTGGRPALQRVWADFRIRVEKDGDRIGHGNLMYAIDGNGLIKLRYLGVPPEQVLAADLERLIG